MRRAEALDCGALPTGHAVRGVGFDPLVRTGASVRHGVHSRVRCLGNSGGAKETLRLEVVLKNENAISC